MFYIKYLDSFQNDLVKTMTLINIGSKINVITPDFAVKLGLKSKPTNVGRKKIDGLFMETYNMVQAIILL